MYNMKDVYFFLKLRVDTSDTKLRNILNINSAEVSERNQVSPILLRRLCEGDLSLFASYIWKVGEWGTERNDARGVKVPNWECPNWTELPTIRHSLVAKPSEEKKGEEKAARSFYRVPLSLRIYTEKRRRRWRCCRREKDRVSQSPHSESTPPYVSLTNA